MNNSTQFHIELDGLNLQEDQIRAIAADLDKVVSTHLAKVDLGGDRVTVGRPIFLNPEWIGIWIRNAKSGALTTVGSVAELPKVLAGLPQDPSPNRPGR
jgi:hypothetical protein